MGYVADAEELRIQAIEAKWLKVAMWVSGVGTVLTGLILWVA